MSSTDPQLHVLALCAVEGASWSLIARELQKRGASGITRLEAGDILEVSAEATKTRDKLMLSADGHQERLDHAAEAVAEAFAAGAKLTTVLDDDYPANLRLIPDLPPFLFYRGRLERDDAFSVAVVGTRDASADGLARSRKMAKGLVGRGVTVLSGLARGIDTAAHEATLDAGGRTIAVLGTGILRMYPPENAALAERIVEQGALVSQFWPAQGPARHTFPRRNTVTSGMSQGTVVVEASSTSGAKMQARLALAHNKRVFLIRDLVTRQSWAQKYVADRDAVQVESVEEVLDALRPTDDVERVVQQRRQLTLDVM